MAKFEDIHYAATEGRIYLYFENDEGARDCIPFELNDAIEMRKRLDLAINRAQANSPEARIEAFHRKRRMFIIRTDRLFIAPENDWRSHVQWIEEEGCDYDPLDIRGYYLDNNLYFYRGKDFRCDSAVLSNVAAYVEDIYKRLSLDPRAVMVWAGVKIGKPGDQWLGKHYLGTIQELLNL